MKLEKYSKYHASWMHRDTRQADTRAENSVAGSLRGLDSPTLQIVMSATTETIRNVGPMKKYKHWSIQTTGLVCLARSKPSWLYLQAKMMA